MRMRFIQRCFIFMTYMAMLFVLAMGCANAAVASYADAVAKASPAVVNLYTKRMRQQHPLLMNNPFLRDLNPKLRQRMQESLGSGVVVSKNGYVLTNSHVVRGAKSIKVAFSNGKTAQAKIIGVDPATDLAVIKVQQNNLQAIRFAKPNAVRVGDVVLAIGNPFGLNQSVTMGIVSAIGRNKLGVNRYEDFIQTDAAINPGNSGGALVNTDGELLGINAVIYSRSGGNNGIGFAIPVSLIKQVMAELIQHGSVQRGWLGVGVREIDLKKAKSFGYKYNGGVYIAQVADKSPASRAGLKVHDIVLAVNGVPVKNIRTFFKDIAGFKPKQKVGFLLLRDGKEKRITVKLGQRPLDNTPASPARRR